MHLSVCSLQSWVLFYYITYANLKRTHTVNMHQYNFIKSNNLNVQLTCTYRLNDVSVLTSLTRSAVLESVI